MTIALMLVTGLASLEGTVVTTAMPTVVGDLGGLGLYSWVFSVYLLGATITMPVYGRLADLFGRRRMILIAIGLFLAGAAASALALSMPLLVLARGLQGLGAGGLVPIAQTVAGDLYTIEERARIQGLFSGVWGVASLAGPLLGAGLTVAFGWRSVFAFVVPVAAIAGTIVVLKMKESRPARTEGVDWPGIALLALGIVGILVSTLERVGGGGFATGTRLLFAAVGGALLLVFVRVEFRVEHPLIPVDLFRPGSTLSPYLSAVLMGTIIFGVDTFVPLFVQGARGGSPGAAGAVITPLVFFWSLSALLGARAVVRFGFRATALFGSVAIFAALAGLVVAVEFDLPVSAISVATGLLGCGLGPVSISQILAIQQEAEERRRGIATSLVPFFRTLGGSIGVGALGGLFSAGLGRTLGGAAEGAGRALAGGGFPAGLTEGALRIALEGSLRPVFAILLGISFVNLLAAPSFPLRRSRDAADAKG